MVGGGIGGVVGVDFILCCKHLFIFTNVNKYFNFLDLVWGYVTYKKCMYVSLYILLVKERKGKERKGKERGRNIICIFQ